MTAIVTAMAAHRRVAGTTALAGAMVMAMVVRRLVGGARVAMITVHRRAAGGTGIARPRREGGGTGTDRSHRPADGVATGLHHPRTWVVANGHHKAHPAAVIAVIAAVRVAGAIDLTWFSALR
jgi:hypothetical protein